MSDSLKKRYMFKLGSKIINLILGLITVGIVPRALGPSQYGSFSFLTFFFSRIIKFMKLGTGSAYFTKLSARQKEPSLIGFYFTILFIISTLVLVFVNISLLTHTNDMLWPDQLPVFIYAAAGFSLLSLVSKVLHDTNDALGFTVINELVFITQSILLTGLILLVNFKNSLNLNNYFLILYLMQLFLIPLEMIIIIFYGKHSLKKMFALSKQQFKVYTKEFSKYSHPLLTKSVIVPSLLSVYEG